MDNKAAEAKGGSATKGVDISMAFNSELDLSAFEEAAARSAGKTASCSKPETSEPTISAGVNFSTWSASSAGDTRLAQHAHSNSFPYDKLDNRAMAELLTKTKTHTTNGVNMPLDTAGLAQYLIDLSKSKVS